MTLYLTVFALLGSAAGRCVAQLSPGELSRVHSELDSSRACLECHSAGKGVTRELCLSCHSLLGQRIEKGEGLHARTGYESCETCHIEHHGREFELIWWGKVGIEGFDHTATGYPLVGAHRRACRSCHEKSRIAEPERLIEAGKDLDRTFLGLGTECTACHVDEHRGEMQQRSCSECHDENAWRPASGFDHDRTAFALDGRHARAPCAACHARGSGEESEIRMQYRGLATACVDCHRTPHSGRLGRDCAACHRSSDWREVSRAGFDHDLTRFSLLGRHRPLDCVKCHSGASFRLAGVAGVAGVADVVGCADCHADVHLGQFLDREGGGACSDCHDENGFKPSRFDLADHAKTRFALEAAHRTLPCNSCHPRVATAELVARGVATDLTDGPASTRAFRIEASECSDCHRDPHSGSADAFLGEVGCESCHNERDWREVTFDHGATGFDLRGSHRLVACVQCHKVSGRGEVELELNLRGAPTACRGCHQDRHLGQFDLPGALADCRDCHSLEGWMPSLFEHNRSSTFLLEGKHARAKCSACHLPEMIGREQVVRYRPLPTACSGCHRLQLSSPGAADVH